MATIVGTAISMIVVTRVVIVTTIVVGTTAGGCMAIMAITEAGVIATVVSAHTTVPNRGNGTTTSRPDMVRLAIDTRTVADTDDCLAGYRRLGETIPQVAVFISPYNCSLVGVNARRPSRASGVFLFHKVLECS